MSCIQSLVETLGCDSNGTMGGTAKLYMLAHADLEPLSGTTLYSTDENGAVDDLGVTSGKAFVEIGYVPNTLGLNAEFSVEGGNNFFNNSMPVQLGGLSSANRAFVKSVRSQPVVAMVKLATGKYFIAGLNGLFRLSAGTAASGVQAADANGYTLTFSGQDLSDPMEVADTLVAELLAA